MHPNAVFAETVHYATAIPPYPISSDKGYAYVINTTQIDEADATAPWDAGKTRGSKYHRIGILVGWIWPRVECYLDKKACVCKSANLAQLASCKPVLKRSLALAPGEHYQYFLRCHNYPDEMDFGCQTHHRSVIVPDKFSSNVEIREMFRTILDDPKAHRRTNSGLGCCTVDRKHRGKKTCDETHTIGGQGMMKHIKCDVKFSILIPRDRAKKSPYIIFVSHGKHSHAPPPQTSIPRAIRDKLDKSIRDALTESRYTTVSKKTWIRSHAMQVFLQEHNAPTLSHVHPALSNDDRLNYFIAKQKGIHQNGFRGREAVRFEWLMNHEGNPETAYIQSFYDDGKDFLAVCFTQGMAKLWKDCKTFQFDMNFKRVNGNKDHEVIFARRIDDKFSFMPLARAYMSGQSAEDYRRLFETLFNCLQKNGVTIQWKYAEGEGVVGVTVDQDAGCIKGLGLYLADKYPNKSSDWQYHTERTVRLCEVHFKRGITTVLKKRGIRAGHSKATAMMKSLLTVKTSRLFYKLCGRIAEKWPKLSDWVRHKKQRFIVSGLTHACSPLSPEDWHTIGSDTNGVESQHQKAYTEGGQFVSLIEAVKRYYNYLQTGKRDRWRNTTAEGREDLSQLRHVGELYQHLHLEYPVLAPLRRQLGLGLQQHLPNLEVRANAQKLHFKMPKTGLWMRKSWLTRQEKSYKSCEPWFESCKQQQSQIHSRLKRRKRRLMKHSQRY
ncbi:uncharacterized protein CPUR_08858 [Claviceps purpurea 20.1]|uniref:Uncharacterized protein n=1 Tax=Claviceps purpurea (strain 20.1) TaxID=1111077 RepID=M1WIR1_CLAP2|nr:uncharacterized protein CPUR_08858 [Claviceps purpurea 20.1]